MIRPATIHDVPRIQEIINSHAELGKMLFRSLAQLYEGMRDLAVYELDRRVVGCVGMAILWADLAEVRSLAVDDAFRGRGIGSRLVEWCIDEARRLQIRRLMSLTYEQAFFEKLGFEVVSKDTLPLKVWSDCVRCPKRDGCDEIVFAGMPTVPPGLMVERAARDHIAIGFAPAGLRPQLHGLDFLVSHRQPRLVARRLPACTPINTLFKRLFDVAAATFGLLLTWPALLLGMIAIMIESGRPVIFRQVRVGRDGRPFEILKLRTMALGAEAQSGPVWAVGDPTKDARATKVGAFLRKTSIDELPQFINVLLGDMSIVGPRPERPVFVEQFRKEFPRYDERHLVRPGITGWAHVHMQRSPSLEEIGERLELDLFYVENYSLLLDVFIAFKTGVEVLFQHWA